MHQPQGRVWTYLSFIYRLEETSTISCLGFLWATILYAASQTEASSVSHSRLTDLLLAIREQPSPQETPAIIERKDIRRVDVFWCTLPLISPVRKDLDIAAPLHPRLSERQYYKKYRSHTTGATVSYPGPWRNDLLISAQWASINAVLAKEHARTKILYLDLRGLFALYEALEYDHDDLALADLVPAASVWVIFAGTRLKFDHVGYPSHGDDMGSGRHPWSAGPSWKSKKGFSKERWSFWKERFRATSLRRDLESETAGWAQRASDAMSKIDAENP